MTVPGSWRMRWANAEQRSGSTKWPRRSDRRRRRRFRRHRVGDAHVNRSRRAAGLTYCHAKSRNRSNPMSAMADALGEISLSPRRPHAGEAPGA